MGLLLNAGEYEVRYLAMAATATSSEVLDLPIVWTFSLPLILRISYSLPTLA